MGLLSVVVAVANSSTRRNIKAGADGSTGCIIVQCGRGTRCELAEVILDKARNRSHGRGDDTRTIYARYI